MFVECNAHTFGHGIKEEWPSEINIFFVIGVVVRAGMPLWPIYEMKNDIHNTHTHKLAYFKFEGIEIISLEGFTCAKYIISSYKMSNKNIRFSIRCSQFHSIYLNKITGVI